MLFRVFERLWRDQCGGISVASQILLTAILAIGGIVGLVTFRDQVVQEFGDLGVALETLDQSFTTSSATYGSFTDTPTALTDPDGGAPAGLTFVLPVAK